MINTAHEMLAIPDELLSDQTSKIEDTPDQRQELLQMLINWQILSAQFVALNLLNEEIPTEKVHEQVDTARGLKKMIRAVWERN